MFRFICKWLWGQYISALHMNVPTTSNRTDGLRLWYQSSYHDFCNRCTAHIHCCMLGCVFFWEIWKFYPLVLLLANKTRGHVLLTVWLTKKIKIADCTNFQEISSKWTKHMTICIWCIYVMFMLKSRWCEPRWSLVDVTYRAIAQFPPSLWEIWRKFRERALAQCRSFFIW